MPMYEYQCKECGLFFEARQKFSDAPLTACKGCGGPVAKMISQTGFALKGAAGTIRVMVSSQRPARRQTVAAVAPAARKRPTSKHLDLAAKGRNSIPSLFCCSSGFFVSGVENC